MVVNQAAPVEFHPWTKSTGFRTGASGTPLAVLRSGPVRSDPEQAARRMSAARRRVDERRGRRMIQGLGWTSTLFRPARRVNNENSYVFSVLPGQTRSPHNSSVLLSARFALKATSHICSLEP